MEIFFLQEMEKKGSKKWSRVHVWQRGGVGVKSCLGSAHIDRALYVEVYYFFLALYQEYKNECFKQDVTKYL